MRDSRAIDAKPLSPPRERGKWKHYMLRGAGHMAQGIESQKVQPCDRVVEGATQAPASGTACVSRSEAEGVAPPGLARGGGDASPFNGEDNED
jgi:hypothetical protein